MLAALRAMLHHVSPSAPRHASGTPSLFERCALPRAPSRLCPSPLPSVAAPSPLLIKHHPPCRVVPLACCQAGYTVKHLESEDASESVSLSAVVVQVPACRPYAPASARAARLLHMRMRMRMRKPPPPSCPSRLRRPHLAACREW